MDAKTKKILTKLGKEKVELASNIQQILKQLEIKDSVFIQEEKKVSKAFEKWEMAYQMWFDTLTDTDSDLDDTENDLQIFIKKASDLGLDTQQIKGVDKARRMIKDLRNYINQEKGIDWSV